MKIIAHLLRNSWTMVYVWQSKVEIERWWIAYFEVL